jgi:arginine N-succinyltransferase
MIIRPVRTEDFENILSLAKAAGIGMTSLPAHAEVLQNKIDKAVQSFVSIPHDEAQKKAGLYFFVLEDEASKQIVGTTAIEAFVGLKRPFYSYKLTTVTQYSDVLNIYSRNDILQIVNDYTGCSEIGSLFLTPEYRRDRLGRLLSRIRFLFMGAFQQCFADKVIAEIRGWHDGAGNSPFYDSLATHFFQMPFTQADWISATQGNKFISELAPSYPIYVSLLPPAARECIGRAYVNSEPAKAMLEREGFYYNNYLDIFDGGPTLESDLLDIATIKNMGRAHVVAIADLPAEYRMMIAKPDFSNFRGCIGYVRCDNNEAIIDKQSADLLQIALGDEIIFANA